MNGPQYRLLTFLGLHWRRESSFLRWEEVPPFTAKNLTSHPSEESEQDQ